MSGDAVAALVEAARAGVDFDGLRVERRGERYYFAVPGHHEEGLSEAAVRELATEYSDYVSEWYFWHALAPQTDGRWAFLRWLEDAAETALERRVEALESGMTHTWGQLHIRVRHDGPGDRRYAIRHVDDHAEPVGELTSYSGPEAVDALARHDASGQYRPLRTAPTLQTGWVFPDLGPEAVVETVEAFYPATIANWHRERRGELDVTHWHETASRQTGIYDLVDELGGDQVDWLAEACCVDSQCLKRREWDETAERELDVPRGDGAFPCREPCSMVVAAAREFALDEREDAEAHAMSVTPGQRDQLEAILDAVAEGRTEAIRDGDFDDPANRYRVRYLRAKLFGDGGESGHPTAHHAGEEQAYEDHADEDHAGEEHAGEEQAYEDHADEDQAGEEHAAEDHAADSH